MELTNLLTMPNEIFLLIFSFLENIDILNLHNTNKLLRDLTTKDLGEIIKKINDSKNKLSNIAFGKIRLYSYFSIKNKKEINFVSHVDNHNFKKFYEISFLSKYDMVYMSFKPIDGMFHSKHKIIIECWMFGDKLFARPVRNLLDLYPFSLSNMKANKIPRRFLGLPNFVFKEIIILYELSSNIFNLLNTNLKF